MLGYFSSGKFLLNEFEWVWSSTLYVESSSTFNIGMYLGFELQCDTRSKFLKIKVNFKFTIVVCRVDAIIIAIKKWNDSIQKRFFDNYIQCHTI